MTWFRPMVVLGLAVVMTVGASTGLAEKPNKGGKKKSARGVHGVVVDVQKDKDEGFITVRVHAQKNKGETAQPQAEQKKFRVNKDTKFEFVTGKKGERQRKPATFADVHKDEHVLIIAKSEGNMAERVEILGKGKQNKKATKAD